MAIESQISEENRRVICFDDEPAAHEEVSTSEPSTSRPPSTPLSSLSPTSSLTSLLDVIGPVQSASPRPKSNRGR